MTDSERLRFGNRVRHIRKELGITQAELAAATGIDRGYLAGVESGLRNPTLTIINRIAYGLNVSARELFEKS